MAGNDWIGRLSPAGRSARMSQMMEPPPSSASPQRVECPASREPAVRRTILAVVLLAVGLWCYSARNDPEYRAPEAWDLKNISQVLKYVLNHYGAYVLVPAGAVVLLWTGVQLRKKLVADETGIGFAGQEKIAWGQVDSLDGRGLQTKGIVVLHAGARRMVLDSYFLLNFRELIALVEQHVPAEKQVLK
jgi:hypothetical protein